MSADIEAIRARLAAYAKYRWWFLRGEDTHEGCECDECRAALAAHHEYNGHSQEDIAALLAENERLQRERSEWCDQADRRLTDYMTQQRDLLAENAALRARLTLTPERIEAAVAAWWSTGWARTVAESDSQMSADIRRWLRAALLAAGMTEEQ